MQNHPDPCCCFPAKVKKMPLSQTFAIIILIGLTGKDENDFEIIILFGTLIVRLEYTNQSGGLVRVCFTINEIETRARSAL